MKRNHATTQPRNHATIAVIGGGLAGMTQAIALAKAGLDVTVIDHEDPRAFIKAEFDGRVSAIAWRSYKFLKKIGVWEKIAPHAEPILDIRVSEFGSKLFLHFDHEEIGNEPFGYIVENRHSRAALYEVARKMNNLHIIAPAKVAKLDIKNARLEVENNHQPSTINYQLLIGADGKNSLVRKTAGIGETRKSYKQHAIVCTIEHEKPHMGLAHEHFIPAGPFAVLPMKGRVGSRESRIEKKRSRDSRLPTHNSSLVWTEPSDIVKLYMKMDDAEFLKQIEKRVKHLGKIKVLEGRWCYPLEVMHADEYAGHNFALVGDAAHAIHPIAGQGVNLGFRDVELLTEKIIGRGKLGLPINSATMLEEYERERRLDNMAMIAATDGLTRLFSNNIYPIKLARTLGLGMVQQIPPLKRAFMRYASGKK